MAKASCRKAFMAELLESARHNESIWSIATDSRGSAVTEKFAAELPDRFVECGIAEQNAVSIACGLSMTGKNVFVCGPACFLVGRAYEQLKLDVAYNSTNVKIIGVSAGVSYGPLGCSHTTMNDFAAVRALPNIRIAAPADDVEAKWLARFLASDKAEGPFYVRMGRGEVEKIYDEDTEYEFGKAKTIRDGKDVTIIACGETVYHAAEAAKLLATEGISARVLDMFTIKPLDTDAVTRAVRETGGIITVEEHSTCGGLGEAVAHAASELGGRVKILGLPEEVIIGKTAELFRYYGLTAENIAAEAKRIIG